MKVVHRILFVLSAVLAAVAALYALGMAAWTWKIAVDYGMAGRAWRLALLAAQPGLLLAPVLALGAWAFRRGAAGWAVKVVALLAGGLFLATAVWMWTVAPIWWTTLCMAVLGLLCAAPLTLPKPPKS